MNCGKSPSNEVKAIMNENDYEGDYFCSDECRDEKRAKQGEIYDDI